MRFFAWNHMIPKDNMESCGAVGAHHKRYFASQTKKLSPTGTTVVFLVFTNFCYFEGPHLFSDENDTVNP